MSYDFTFEIDTGGSQPAAVEYLNVPWSARNVLMSAFGCPVTDLDGRLASDLVERLDAIVDAELGVDSIEDLARAAHRHPKATVRVS